MMWLTFPSVKPAVKGFNKNHIKPNYRKISKKKKLVNYWKKILEKEKKAKIFLATDPDREGEAIAKEVIELLKLPSSQQCRLLFYEITPQSIKESLEKPLEVNQNLISSQTARQVLDRMIGFCLSPLLKKKYRAFSAGRVQSVALKLIIKRELLIRENEKKKEYLVCAIKKITEKKLTYKNLEGNAV